MKQTRLHLQISPLGLVNKYGSKNPKTSLKQESHQAYGTAVSMVDILLNEIHLNHIEILAIHLCIFVNVLEQYPMVHMEGVLFPGN